MTASPRSSVSGLMILCLVGAAYGCSRTVRLRRAWPHGLSAMFDAEYLGSHWIGTFAVRYLIAQAG